MAVQTLTFGKQRFVVLPESEYRKLKDRTGKTGATKRRKVVSSQERGDIAEAKRRAGETSIPFETARKRMGL